MTSTRYAHSVPVFKQMLTALKAILQQAQFFFYVSTAYALLRHNGLAIGKRDYMGSY